MKVHNLPGVSTGFVFPGSCSNLWSQSLNFEKGIRTRTIRTCFDLDLVHVFLQERWHDDACKKDSKNDPWDAVGNAQCPGIFGHCVTQWARSIERRWWYLCGHPAMLDDFWTKTWWHAKIILESPGILKWATTLSWLVSYFGKDLPIVSNCWRRSTQSLWCSDVMAYNAFGLKAPWRSLEHCNPISCWIWESWTVLPFNFSWKLANLSNKNKQTICRRTRTNKLMKLLLVQSFSSDAPSPAMASASDNGDNGSPCSDVSC